MSKTLPKNPMPAVNCVGDSSGAPTAPCPYTLRGVDPTAQFETNLYPMAQLTKEIHICGAF